MSGRHRAPSSAERVRVAFAGGSRLNGWCCRTCDKRFDHTGRSRHFTFVRFMGHLALSHKRLPDATPIPGATWTITGRATWIWEASR